MLEPAKVAIVILNWNGQKLLEKFLPSVLKYSNRENTEIIIADNNSSDKSIDFVNTTFPSVKTIVLDKNYGFAEGYNRALEKIDAEFFILLNSDVEVSENWIAPCIEQFIKDKKIAAIQPKILSYNEPELLEYAGAAGGFIDKFGYPFCRGRILNRLETDNQQYQTSTQIFWASGACMFVRASTFKEVGGFDADFWAHMEEIDMCWRLKGRGYKIVYQPQSVIYHLGGGTLSYGSPQKVYLNFRNNLWMLYKNLPKFEFKRKLIIRMILDGVAAVKFLAGFHFKSSVAVLNAHISFYKNLEQLRKKRKEIQKHAVVGKHKEIYPKSIMWKFFIQNKKMFSKLNFKPE